MCAKSQQSGNAASPLGPIPTQPIAITHIEITLIDIAHIVRSYDDVACPGCVVSIR